MRSVTKLEKLNGWKNGRSKTSTAKSRLKAWGCLRELRCQQSESLRNVKESLKHVKEERLRLKSEVQQAREYASARGGGGGERRARARRCVFLTAETVYRAKHTSTLPAQHRRCGSDVWHLRRSGQRA